MRSPENAGVKQKGGRFQPRKSGNPAGKPRGARNKATRAVEALLDGEAERLTRKAIERALGGEAVALRLCLGRICPPRRDLPITFTLPRIQTAADAANAMSALLAAVAAGEITPSEATEIAGLLDGFLRAREATEMEARLAALEGAQERTP